MTNIITLFAIFASGYSDSLAQVRSLGLKLVGYGFESNLCLYLWDVSLESSVLTIYIPDVTNIEAKPTQ